METQFQTAALVASRAHSRPSPELSVVVPAFNEEQRLPGLLDDLTAVAGARTTEVIIVDDASTDETVRVAESFADRIGSLKIERHLTNRGKGAAVRTGVAASTGAMVVFLDADNATDLGALPEMLQRLGGSVGAVFGSRHIEGADVVGAPALRGFMGRVFNHLVRITAATPILDTQCGAKAFRGPAARLVFSQSKVDGFAFDVEILRLLLALGLSVEEHPVRWVHRAGSKVRALTPLHMMVDIARVRLRPGWAPIRVVDTNWSELVAQLSEPLHGDVSIAVGEEVSIAVTSSDSAASSALAARLRREGLWASERSVDLHDWIASARIKPSAPKEPSSKEPDSKEPSD